ncbi:MAG: DinB family protein [Actinomycetota bacterium]
MSTGTAKSTNIANGLIAELTQEAATTRKILERIPVEKYDYKPHEKSMTMIRLATHVAEMIDWIPETCTKDELDFATMDYKPFEPQTTAELVEFHDKNIAAALEALKNTSDEDMHKDWSLKNGETTYFTMTKIACLRTMCFNHIWHHRGQLSVYLRLNDIPVPSIYGPSADEGQM